MNYTVDILQRVSDCMLKMATVTKATDASSSTLVLQGASNILEAMIKDEQHGATEPHVAREIVEKSTHVVQTLMQV